MKYRIHAVDVRAKYGWSGSYIGEKCTSYTEVIEAENDQEAIERAREIVRQRYLRLNTSDTLARCHFSPNLALKCAVFLLTK